jgi:hypothetical protein
MEDMDNYARIHRDVNCHVQLEIMDGMRTSYVRIRTTWLLEYVYTPGAGFL